MTELVTLYLRAVARELIEDVDPGDYRDKLWAEMTPAEQTEAARLARTIFEEWIE